MTTPANPKKVVISRRDRDKVLRQALLDDSKVWVNFAALRSDGPAKPRTDRRAQPVPLPLHPGSSRRPGDM